MFQIYVGNITSQPDYSAITVYKNIVFYSFKKKLSLLIGSYINRIFWI